jgi:hypothetical protein
MERFDLIRDPNMHHRSSRYDNNTAYDNAKVHNGDVYHCKSISNLARTTPLTCD